MEPIEQQAATPITLVFTDMVGSSAAKRASALGADAVTRDEAFLDVVQSRHLHVVRECLPAYNGKEIMTIGDAFFLTFDNPQSALLCCSEIQLRLKAAPIMTVDGPLKLRIGIHVGTPKYFENSWHGTDVDIASRAESAGSGEQIILTDAARRQLGDLLGIQLRPLGTFALKGVGDVKLWDADYDQHGPRKPQLLSHEQIRRKARLKILRQAGYAALAASLVAGAFLFYQHSQRNRITEKDKLILADFDNKTGDPVFDATLKEALSIQLEQSPVLQLVGDEEIHADLRYLNQPTEQRITPALAREVGQREGIKAYIAASLVSLGNSYVISVDAFNCATGDPIARVQVEAADKNHVLAAVSTAASKLRARLGESLASVQKLTSPWMDVTTSSLEAFHAFSLGEDAHRKGSDPEALVFYKQAVELDPNFAMAYARLGIAEASMGRINMEIDYLSKAYNLREHATERERLYIEATLALAKGDIPGTLTAYQSLLEAYPNDPAGLNNSANTFQNAGDPEKAVAYYKKLIATAPWDMVASDNLAGVLLQTDRSTEAKTYIDKIAATAYTSDTSFIGNQIIYAFETGDPSWRQLASTGSERPDAFTLDQQVSDNYYLLGSLTEGRNAALRSSQSALRAKSPDFAGNALATAALFEAEFGECSQVPILTSKALAVDTSIQTLPGVSIALALCGQGSAALTNLEKLGRSMPDNTLLNSVYIPVTQATIALSQKHPEKVSALLDSNRTYPLTSAAPIVEAEALLQLHRPVDAINILQPALHFRYYQIAMGSIGQAPSYTMATLLTARAQAMKGDKAAASQSYQHAIELWKNADAGFKPLEEARRELAALNQK
jgi:class 3 adenylate cyclase/tetratricopeptide (TPR) repeat protein